MKHLDTQPLLNVPNGLERCVMLERIGSQSTLQSLDVLRSLENFVLLLAVVLRRDLRHVLTELKLLFKAPKEECSLEPQRTCAHVTKLVPKLEPTEECVDVPK